MRNRRGFTLVEVVVVIAVISILASVVLASMGGTNSLKRDAQRKTDLKTVQAAIELYKLKYGAYPAGCNGPNVWSGQAGTDYACSPASADYIVGLAPEFINKLPRDPKLNGSNSGYVYSVDANGDVYKFAALRTVEEDTVLTLQHEMRWCDINGEAGLANGTVAYGLTAEARDAGLHGICNATSENTRGNKEPPPWCLPGSGANPTSDQLIYRTSYAVWGGWAEEPNGYIHRLNGDLGSSNNLYAQTNTERILCELH